jgi:hypothetical protein
MLLLLSKKLRAIFELYEIFGYWFYAQKLIFLYEIKYKKNITVYL